MAESFKCPDCGAPLEVPIDESTSMQCPFCAETIIIPSLYRSTFPTKLPSSPPTAVFNPIPAPPPMQKSGLADIEKRLSDTQPKITKAFVYAIPAAILFIIILVVVIILITLIK